MTLDDSYQDVLPNNEKDCHKQPLNRMLFDVIGRFERIRRVKNVMDGSMQPSIIPVDPNINTERHALIGRLAVVIDLNFVLK